MPRTNSENAKNKRILKKAVRSTAEVEAMGDLYTKQGGRCKECEGLEAIDHMYQVTRNIKGARPELVCFDCLHGH